MEPRLILDLTCLCPEHTDQALEGIYKALGDDPPDDALWSEHPNPFLRRIVELFTERGLMRLNGVREELAKWLSGKMHKPGAPPSMLPGRLGRWTPDELGAVKLYLETLPPERFTLEDWTLVADYLVQRYLPQDALIAEADWIASRSALMGRVQALMGDAEPAEADEILARMSGPTQPGGVPMTPYQSAVLDFGRARCAEHVTAVAEATRRKMRGIVLDHQEAALLGDGTAPAEALETKLVDQFAPLNRDWRRLAVTEATENLNQGFIASQPAGVKVRRFEQYRGACGFCRAIDGKILTVVDPAKPDKDDETEVWVGKTNVGRSASPRRREGGALVERPPSERWRIAAGTMHPNCRGGWTRVAEGVPDDPEFEAWLAARKRGSAPEPS